MISLEKTDAMTGSPSLFIVFQAQRGLGRKTMNMAPRPREVVNGIVVGTPIISSSVK